MLIDSTRFGELEIDETKIITFPDDIPGFDNCTRYILLSSETSDAVHWLQSLDDPMISFCVVDIISIMPDYNPLILQSDIDSLEPDSDDDLLLLSVLVVPDDITKMTVNLVAPIIINHVKNLGKQVILERGNYEPRHPFFNQIQNLLLLQEA